jgi:hypothetical protein
MWLFEHMCVNDYFDRVFVINLRQNLQKWNITAHMLSRYGITWERFAGVNGFEKKQVHAWRTYADSGLTHPFEKILQRKLIESPGAWGTLLSCKHLIEKARLEGLERILILEDDIMIHRDFLTLFPKVAEELPSDWRLIYFGCKPEDWDNVNPFSEHLHYPAAISSDGYRPVTHGAFAYALHVEAFDLALQHIEVMEWPFDSGSLKEINRQFPKQTFAVQPHLFIPDISVSSIREPGDNLAWAQAARAQQCHYEPRQLKFATEINSDNKTSAHLKVVALLVMQDEMHHLERCLQHLHVQGIVTCLIDPGRTIEMTRHFSDQGVFKIEHVPQGKLTESESLFLCKQKLVAEIQADWFILLDTDEILEAPRPYISLLEGIQDANCQGYNTINFDEFVFVPTNDRTAFERKDHIQEMLHYYFFEPEKQRLLKAWKKTVHPVDTDRTEGHSATFPKQKIFPVSFRLRHYMLNFHHEIQKIGQQTVSQKTDTPDQSHFPFQYDLKKLRAPYDWDWDKSEPWKQHAFSVCPEIMTEQKTEPFTVFAKPELN